MVKILKYAVIFILLNNVRLQPILQRNFFLKKTNTNHE